MTYEIVYKDSVQEKVFFSGKKQLKFNSRMHILNHFLVFRSHNHHYWSSLLLFSVLTVDFITDMFPVPEDNGTVTVCLQTNIGSQEELVIDVMATVKTTGSSLASKIA